MPYKSEAQRKFFHTDTARKKGITAKTVKEFDHESKGMDMPAKVAYMRRKRRRMMMAK